MHVEDALRMAFAMFWEIFWALVLGFGISGAVQAVVSKKEMTRLLPDASPSSLVKALALGADAVAIGTAALVALNCNKDIPEADFEGTIGVPAGYCYHCHTGRCPVGVATQDPELRRRLNPDDAAERVYNLLHTLTMECQMMARACGKTNVHSLEPEDLAALTMEASAMAMVPLAGTQHTVGRPDMTRY